MSIQTRTAPSATTGRRLLTAVLLASIAKACLVASTAVVPSWRLGSDAVWGMSDDAVLPLTIVSVVLYLAAGEAARRRLRGAFWFVLVLHATSVVGVIREPGAGAPLPVALRVLSVLLSAAVIVLVLLAPARRALLGRDGVRTSDPTTGRSSGPASG